MEIPSQLLYATIAIAAFAAALGILYPRLAAVQHTGQPPILEIQIHVLRIANVNGTVHITVALEPHEPVWLLKWCLGGHCYTKTMPVSQATIIDLVDVDHAYNPGVKLVMCYQRLEAGQAPPARCISTRLP
ncbi:hypothetical protein Pyrfu_0337 [Pyrolobus fumarii 1A]|uniref:Uncharacterized protein n=1 Tax=Pyrolobus fumarii (strain DSM 11204 / 1A) TaxID=694429 RepID=G0EFN8_PYRF1|nr:hypothetical protein [Pyrolobus fumarii]AEM38209.1 hypothetical protein Pyrfu_0337 [Pyrolobus fumarii 1A]